MNPFKKDKSDPGAPSPEAGVPSVDPAAADAAAALDPAGPDETAALIDDLSAKVDELTRERDLARDEHTRALAEFQNYQRRSLQNEQQAREFGVRGVLQSVMPVIDHFDMALGLDADKSTARQVIDGVTMIKDELLRVLGQHGVALLRPGAGEAFDPQSHEALMRVPAPGIEPGRIVATLRPGYAMHGRVVRPAQVSVAAEAPGAVADQGAEG